MLLQRADQPAQITMNIKRFAVLNISHDNSSLHFQEWKRELNLYIKASGLANRDNETRSAIILLTAGSAVIKIARHFTYGENETENKPKILLQKVEEYCSGQNNEVIETFRFNQVIFKHN